MNGIREGVLNYDSETGASAVLLNLGSTQSLEKMRMSWAISHTLATYTLPLLQTVLLMLLLCLFPIIVLISLQPAFNIQTFKNYLYSIIWVESWPILFSFLNLAVTFYLHHNTGALAKNGLTLANSNPLAQEHVDIANVAGYLMTCIPFISIGIVKGMAWAFNQAANYIGGMVHSAAQGASSEVVSGNISMGNTNLDNVNANKVNTNFSYMHGMRTLQLANGAVMTQTASNHTIYDTSGAISRLPIGINASSVASAHFSHAAETAKQSAQQWGESWSHAVSQASNQLESLGHTLTSHQGIGHNATQSHSSTVTDSAAHMVSLVKDVAERNHASFSDTFQGMSQLSQGFEAHGGFDSNRSIAGKVLGAATGLSAGASARVGATHNRSQSEATTHDVSSSLNVSHGELQQFRQDWNAIKSYSDTRHTDSGHSHNDALLSQVSADFRSAETASHHYSASFSESQRDSQLASFTQTHSAAIQSDFNQAFAEYVRKIDPARADVLLSNTSSIRIAEERQVLAERFIQQYFTQQIAKEFQSTASYTNIEQSYQQGVNTVNGKNQGLQDHYRQNGANIHATAEKRDVNFDTRSAEQLRQSVQWEQMKADKNIHEETQQQTADNAISKEKIEKRVGAWSDKATDSAFWFHHMKPDGVSDTEKESES